MDHRMCKKPRCYIFFLHLNLRSDSRILNQCRQPVDDLTDFKARFDKELLKTWPCQPISAKRQEDRILDLIALQHLGVDVTGYYHSVCLFFVIETEAAPRDQHSVKWPGQPGDGRPLPRLQTLQKLCG
jgi:hypothetical protein